MRVTTTLTQGKGDLSYLHLAQWMNTGLRMGTITVRSCQQHRIFGCWSSSSSKIKESLCLQIVGEVIQGWNCSPSMPRVWIEMCILFTENVALLVDAESDSFLFTPEIRAISHFPGSSFTVWKMQDSYHEWLVWKNTLMTTIGYFSCFQKQMPWMK